MPGRMSGGGAGGASASVSFSLMVVSVTGPTQGCRSSHSNEEAGVAITSLFLEFNHFDFLLLNFQFKNANISGGRGGLLPGHHYPPHLKMRNELLQLAGGIPIFIQLWVSVSAPTLDPGHHRLKSILGVGAGDTGRLLLRISFKSRIKGGVETRGFNPKSL